MNLSIKQLVMLGLGVVVLMGFEDGSAAVAEPA